VLAAGRGLSQLTASFFASWHQGIPDAPLVACLRWFYARDPPLDRLLVSPRALGPKCAVCLSVCVVCVCSTLFLCADVKERWPATSAGAEIGHGFAQQGVLTPAVQTSDGGFCRHLIAGQKLSRALPFQLFWAWRHFRSAAGLWRPSEAPSSLPEAGCGVAKAP
jgi:hypothetical protein